MYDLTGGLRIGKLHQRISKDEALRTCRRCRADRVAASYVYYDAQTDDARLTLTIARTAADYGAAIANYTTRRRPRQGHRRPRAAARRVDADGQTIDVRAPRGRERDRRVVRRRARARRGHAPVVDPAGQGRAHHGAVVEGAQRHRGGDPGAEGPALGVRRAVGRRGGTTSSPTSAPPTPTTTARSTTRSARPTTSTYLLRAINAAVTTTDHRVRRPRHVGRSAPARARPRRASAPPTSRAATRCARPTSGVITVTGGKLTTYRRMAADTIDAVVEATRDRRPRASRTKRVRLARRRRVGTRAELPTDLGDALRQRRGARCSRSRAPTRRWREPLVPGLAVHARPRPCTRCATRWPAPSTTCSSRRTRARLLARDASAAAAADVAALIARRARVDATPSATARSPRTAALVDAEREHAAGCPRPRSTRSTQPPS